MEVSKFPNNYLQRKQEDQYLVQNVFLNLTSFQLLYAINFLMPYFFPYQDTALRYGVLTTELMLRNNDNNYYYYQKREKHPIEKLEKLHTQIYKHFIGVNRRAINIISHNIVLSLKSNISISVIKFWLPLRPLVSLPDTSIEKQCLLLSNQHAKTVENRLNFMLSFHEIKAIHPLHYSASSYINYLQLYLVKIKPLNSR